MKSSGLAVFVLFFGLALVEAIQKGNWVEAAIFVCLGIVFLWADTRRSAKPQ